MTTGPTLFTDGILDASVTYGVARITLAQTQSDGKPVPAGQLVVPLMQLPAMVNGLAALLKQVETKMREQQAQQAQQAQQTISEPGAAPAAGAFRLG